MSKKILLKKILAKSKNEITLHDRLLVAIFALGMVLLSGFLLYLIWFTLTNRSVTHFLPAEKTTAYFELEDLSLPPQMSQDSVLSLVGLKAIIENTFHLEVEQLRDHLTQGRLGLALIQDGASNESVLFFRLKSRKKALAFFESLLLEGETLIARGEDKYLIYSFPQGRELTFSFVGPYLFMAKSTGPLEKILAVYQGETASLNSDEAFNKSLSNLPKQTWGTGYVAVQAVKFTDNPLNQLVEPLKHVVDHFALTVRKQSTGFQFNTLLSLNPDILALKKGFTDSTRFSYDLSDYVGSKRIAAYIGGANLSDEWQSTLDTISQLNPAYGIILEGLVRAQVSHIFGDEVTLRRDIYPLFEGEYALAFETQENGKLGIKLLLKHDDREFAELKLAKLLTGFERLAAQFSPKLKEFTLPDGTESREWVADPSRLKEIEETYEDYLIGCLDVQGSAFGFCYTVTDELIVMTNNLESAKETIDLTTSQRFVLSQYQPFRQTLSNLSAVSDEVTFIDLTRTIPLLKNSTLGVWANNLLSPFEAVTWVKHYFNDGVSTEGYLLVR